MFRWFCPSSSARRTDSVSCKTCQAGSGTGDACARRAGAVCGHGRGGVRQQPSRRPPVGAKQCRRKFAANFCAIDCTWPTILSSSLLARPRSGREPWERAGGRRAMGGVSWAATHVRRSPWPAAVMCRAAARPLVRLTGVGTHTRARVPPLAGRVVACTWSRCEGCVQTRGARTQSGATRRAKRAHPSPHNRLAAVSMRYFSDLHTQA